MKRLIAAAILIVFVIGTYVTSYFYIDNTCKKTNELLKNCVTAYEKGEDVKTHTKKLEIYWSSKENSLSVIMNHASMDEIELTIEALSVHGNYPQNEMFFEYSNTLSLLLHQLMEDTAFGMHSIL